MESHRTSEHVLGHAGPCSACGERTSEYWSLRAQGWVWVWAWLCSECFMGIGVDAADAFVLLVSL